MNKVQHLPNLLIIKKDKMFFQYNINLKHII
jgi:hypothetical protein